MRGALVPKPVPSFPFTKVLPPKTSWWAQKTREKFREALSEELPRLKLAAKYSGGEWKVVGSHYGKV